MSGEGSTNKSTRKQNFFAKMLKLFEESSRILFVGADNVGSAQLQGIRKALRGQATILMGKNTMIRKGIRGLMATRKELEAVLPNVRGNVGMIFVHGDNLGEVKKIVESHKKPATAKAGTTAPNDVTIPGGNTGMEPTKTSFFQALNIPTKISKGQIEIISDVHILTTGQKVGASESALLAMLGIEPFKYGLKCLNISDNGEVYPASVLDVDEEVILTNLRKCGNNIAQLSLAVGYPTAPAVPHMVLAGFKNLLSIAVATNFSFKQADQIKEYLKNPSAFAQKSAPTEAKGGKPDAKGKPEAKKEEKKVEKVEEPAEDEDMGFSLFD